jgi:hypothetical protein
MGFNYLKPKVAIDIFVYTPEEFEEMKGRSFLLNLFLKKVG